MAALYIYIYIFFFFFFFFWGGGGRMNAETKDDDLRTLGPLM